MAIVARNPKTPRWHVVLTGQKLVPEDKKFAVEYVMMDMQTEANMRDNIIQVRGAGDERQENYHVGEQDVTVLKTCMRGWKNLTDEEGKEVTYSPEKLDWLEPKIREEIIRVIRGDDPLSSQRKKEYDENLN